MQGSRLYGANISVACRGLQQEVPKVLRPRGTTAWNVFVHVLMVAGVAVLQLVPPLERWVNQQVMG